MAEDEPGEQINGSGDLIQSEESYLEIAKPWLDEFFEYYPLILDLLNDIQRLHLNNKYMEGHQTMRDFSNGKPGAFRITAHAVVGDPEYMSLMEDSLEDYEGGSYEDVSRLRNDFSSLDSLVATVYMEQFNDRVSPITAYNSSVGYSESDQSPLIAYQAKSGGTPLFETRMSASASLFLAHSLLSAADEALSAASEQDLPIAEGDIREIIEAQDALEKSVSSLGTYIENVDLPNGSEE